MMSDSEEDIAMDSGDNSEEEEKLLSDDQDDQENDSSDDEIDDTEDSKQKSGSGVIIHKCIYVQFPCKRPDDVETELLKVSDKIKRVQLPRKKSTRFCFVHCKNEEDAIEVEQLLRSNKVCGSQLFVNRKRKIDDPEHRQKLKEKVIERKIAKRDAKRLKKQLKSKKLKKSSKVNKIIVSNIPKGIDQQALKQKFKGCVELQLRLKPRPIAFITFSTSEEASRYIKKRPTIENNELKVRAMVEESRKKQAVVKKKLK